MSAVEKLQAAQRVELALAISSALPVRPLILVSEARRLLQSGNSPAGIVSVQSTITWILISDRSCGWAALGFVPSPYRHCAVSEPFRSARVAPWNSGRVESAQPASMGGQPMPVDPRMADTIAGP